MAIDGDPSRQPFAFLVRDVKRQRAVARGLIDDAEAVARLLASDTAALGSEEIAFLERLRADLLAHARTLGENARDTASGVIRALDRR